MANYSERFLTNPCHYQRSPKSLLDKKMNKRPCLPAAILTLVFFAASANAQVQAIADPLSVVPETA
jgi:hypothetical protein